LISQKSDDLAKTFYVQKATRFLPIFSRDGFDDFNSPAFIPIIAGMPFKVFPFNYSSPDLAPHNHGGLYFQNGLMRTPQIIASEDLRNEPGFNSSRSRVFFKTYFGSETGDPTIHVFTRPNSKIMNRNKIPYSGLIGMSHKSDKYFYKISAGFFASYSTGSVNDRMLSYFDNYYYGKINKQFTGNAELKFKIGRNKELFIYSGIVSFYGWDLSPFLSTFSHFEVINNTLRGTLTNIFKNLSISFRRDEGIGKINKTNITETSEFSIKEYAVRPLWEFGNSSSNEAAIAGNLFTEVEFISASDFVLDQKIKSQNFFTKDINEINYKAGGEFHFNRYYFSPSIIIEFNKHFTDKNAFSAQANFSLIPDLVLSASSVARFPNVNELYGQYNVKRLVNNNIEQYLRSGNQELTYERMNNLQLESFYRNNFITARAKIFYKIVNNPISIITDDSKRLFYNYDIIGETEYVNSRKRSGLGLELDTEQNILKCLKIKLNYKYLDNTDIQFVPKQKININFVYILPFQARFIFNWIYQSRTTWRNYYVSPQNDNLNNTGFSGLLADISSFNIYFDYSLNNFYFFNSIFMRVSFENIFNREMRYHPLGNRLDRAFILSLSGNI
jgi:hypothetical protein